MTWAMFRHHESKGEEKSENLQQSFTTRSSRAQGHVQAGVCGGCYLEVTKLADPKCRCSTGGKILKRPLDSISLLLYCEWVGTQKGLVE